jgi:hypothetical protein
LRELWACCITRHAVSRGMLYHVACRITWHAVSRGMPYHVACRITWHAGGMLYHVARLVCEPHASRPAVLCRQPASHGPAGRAGNFFNSESVSGGFKGFITALPVWGFYRGWNEYKEYAFQARARARLPRADERG